MRNLLSFFDSKTESKIFHSIYINKKKKKKKRCNVCGMSYRDMEIVNLDNTFLICFNCMTHIFQQLYLNGKLSLKDKLAYVKEEKNFNPSKRSVEI